MIESGKVQSTKEVAYSVGYKHVDYFAQSYEKRFGIRPSKGIQDNWFRKNKNVI